MTLTIHTRAYDESHIILATTELETLLAAARKGGPIAVEPVFDDSSSIETEALMRLAEQGGAFDFLLDEREDVYTIEDLQVRYR